jgi:hypothetical protein
MLYIYIDNKSKLMFRKQLDIKAMPSFFKVSNLNNVCLVRFLLFIYKQSRFKGEGFAKV